MVNEGGDPLSAPLQWWPRTACGCGLTAKSGALTVVVAADSIRARADSRRLEGVRQR